MSVGDLIDRALSDRVARRRHFVPGDAVRHMDGREGIIKAITGGSGLTIATVDFEHGGSEPVALGFLEKLAPAFALPTPPRRARPLP